MILLALAWIVVLPSAKPLATPTGDIVATVGAVLDQPTMPGQILARAVVENACRSKGLLLADKDNRRRRFDDDRSQSGEIDGADGYDQIDARPERDRRAARGILADDISGRHGRARRRRDRADVQADPANCTLGRGLALSDDIGNRGCLRSRGENQTHCRACWNACSRGYPLADHLSHRHGITCRGNNRAGDKPCARQNRLRGCLCLAHHVGHGHGADDFDRVPLISKLAH